MNNDNNKKTYNKNHKFFLNVFAIVMGIGVIFGVTYAIFRTTVRGEKTNIISTGNFGLVIQNESTSGISLTNALPMSEEEGKKTSAYTFELKNTGDYDVKYKLGFELDSSSTMPAKAIRYIFNDGNSSLMSSAVETEVSDADGTVKKVYYVEDSYIGKGETKQYSLKMWIDYDATQEEAAGKTFKIKARADGEATKQFEAKTLIAPTAEQMKQLQQVDSNNEWIIADKVSDDTSIGDKWIEYTLIGDSSDVYGITIDIIGDNERDLYIFLNKDYTLEDGGVEYTYKAGYWYKILQNSSGEIINSPRYFGECPFKKSDLSTIYSESYLDYVISLFDQQ